MQLMPSLQVKQKQSLVMTPQLQQAIKLLQMTNLDIAAFLQEPALDNPFIEFDADTQAPAEAGASPSGEVGMAAAAKRMLLTRPAALTVT